MSMKLILLGTGTSTGVPEAGCSCYICQSSDTRDKRQRSSALLVSSRGTRILIDCGPDFWQQSNYIGLDRIDAIVLTHEHCDHTYGIDDLRTIRGSRITLYGQERVLEAQRRRLSYIFGPKPYPGTAELSLQAVEPDRTFCVEDVEVQPILLLHGALPIYGYRFHELGTESTADLCYITDMKSIAPEEWAKVDDCCGLVINALRYLREHPSHQNVLDVIDALGRLRQRPECTVLTHLSHHAPSYERLSAMLPVGLSVGYDYMCIDNRDGRVQLYPFEHGTSLYHLESIVSEDWSAMESMQKEQRQHYADTLLSDSSSTYSSLLMNSLPNGAQIGIHLSLSPVLYPQSVAQLQEMLTKAVHRLLAFYSVPAEDYERYYCVVPLEGTGLPWYEFKLGVYVNDTTEALLGSYALEDAHSLGQLLGKEVDIITTESQLTAYISRSLRDLMARCYGSSLLN